MIVRVVPYQPLSLAFGGFEIQMLAAMDAARSHGVDIAPLDVWSRDANFDLLHVWGMGSVHNPVVTWARRAGKPVVMTALLPYLEGLQGVKAVVRSHIGAKALDRQTATTLSMLVVVNEETSRSAQRLLGIGTDRIAVVPNIVDEVFLETLPPSPKMEFGVKDFFLCVGNVCRRKNQLSVAKAAASIGAQLLIVGELLPGEERYGEDLAMLVAQHAGIVWIRGVAPGSKELLSAFRQCVGFVLPSFDETQPISALEAIAARKPVLLADRAYARQKIYRSACLVDPTSVAAIAEGMHRLMHTPDAYCPPVKNLSECTKSHVGAVYADIYRQVVDRSPGMTS